MLVQHSWTFTNLNLFSSQLCSIREYKTLVGSLFFPPWKNLRIKSKGPASQGLNTSCSGRIANAHIYLDQA